MSELASQLREYNDWRRGALISQPDPVELGQAIDAAIVAIEQRDYLDALAKEYFEKLNGWQSACITAEKQRDELLKTFGLVIDELESRHGNDGNAPGHGHEIPGVWDNDNGKLAGKPCAWCAVWAKAKELRAAIASTKDQFRDAAKMIVAPATANYLHGSLGEAIESERGEL
jgi:hypothetical protein